MAKIRAYVYRDSGVFGSVSYKVYPAVVILRKSDKFELVNTVDDHDAYLSVPEGPFEGGAINKQKVGRKSTYSTQDAKDGPLAVEYNVKVDGKDATANSDPVIIIDPA